MRRCSARRAALISPPRRSRPRCAAWASRCLHRAHATKATAEPKTTAGSRTRSGRDLADPVLRVGAGVVAPAPVVDHAAVGVVGLAEAPVLETGQVGSVDPLPRAGGGV